MTPQIPGNDLFLQMDEIRQWECYYRDVEQSSETAVATARLHLGYLLRFLEKEFKKYTNAVQPYDAGTQHVVVTPMGISIAG